jgi:hypothetical protein
LLHLSTFISPLKHQSMPEQLSHKITLGRAKQMTRLYREQKDQILKPEFLRRDILAISDTISRDAIDRLLAQPGCVAMRIYYGMDDQLRIKPILVGVNEQNEDMLRVQSTTVTASFSAMSTTSTETDTAEETEGEILDESTRCPPGCVTSELNP